MNYANDPFWAYKSSYGPEQRQAYENQVMHDRAAREQHRTELDFAAVAVGALTAGTWFQGREARKRRKEIARYCREHKPHDYGRRNLEYHTESDRLRAETEVALRRIEDEAARVEIGMQVAATPKTKRSLRARLAGLRALADSKRLAYESSLEALQMKYHDVVEYDATLESMLTK